MEKIIVVSGPVIVENDKVLLDRHINDLGADEFWKFCGGRVQTEKERLVETAKRRAKEEIGVDIEILDPNPFLLFAEKETPEGKIDIILVHFLAKRIGEPTPGKGIDAVDWHKIEKLPRNLAPNVVPALKNFGFLK